MFIPNYLEGQKNGYFKCSHRSATDFQDRWGSVVGDGAAVSPSGMQGSVHPSVAAWQPFWEALGRRGLWMHIREHELGRGHLNGALGFVQGGEDFNCLLC